MHTRLGLLLLVALFVPWLAHAEPVELAYDPEEPEAYGRLVLLPDEGIAVLMSPPGAARLTSVRIAVWPPAPGCEDNTMLVLAGGGSGGPGSTLYGPVPVPTPTEFAWVTLEIPADSPVEVSGDFYVAYIQNSDPLACGSLGFAIAFPTAARSWHYAPSHWVPIGASEFHHMIRATVDPALVPTVPITWGRIKHLYDPSGVASE